MEQKEVTREKRGCLENRQTTEFPGDPQLSLSSRHHTTPSSRQTWENGLPKMAEKRAS